MPDELQTPYCDGAIDIVAGLRELELITGSEQLTWKGKDVTCVARTATGTNSWDIVGLADGASVRLYVRKENFLTVDSTLITVDSDLWTVDSVMREPVAGKTLTFRGKTWRIVTAREAGTRSHFELDIGSPDK